MLHHFKLETAPSVFSKAPRTPGYCGERKPNGDTAFSRPST